MAHDGESVSQEDEISQPTKSYVATELQTDEKVPRVKNFRLPNNQVTYLTYLIDKYGEDYKAMAKDPKNYYQETWKQIRNKMKKFKNVPEQYGKYLESKKKQNSTEITS
jgi:hypothetical protein